MLRLCGIGIEDIEGAAFHLEPSTLVFIELMGNIQDDNARGLKRCNPLASKTDMLKDQVHKISLKELFLLRYQKTGQQHPEQ